MLAVVLKPGAALTPAGLGEAAEKSLPRFARPRFVEFVDELPKTATGKVQRAVLRKRGSGNAFDRDAGGTGDADVVAQVEQLEHREVVFGELILLDVDL